MKDAINVIAAIGNTPLIRLKSLPDDDSAEIWVKWEGANPTGSMKDRMALSMIEGAEKRGDLTTRRPRRVDTPEVALVALLPWCVQRKGIVRIWYPPMLSQRRRS